MSRSFTWFVIVGGIGFLVDAGLTTAIAHAGVSTIAARIPAIAAAMLTTWLLNRRFTFGVREQKTYAEALLYAFVALVTALLNFLLYSWLVTVGVSAPLAVAIATGTLMGVSFFGYRRLVFKKRAPGRAER